MRIRGLMQKDAILMAQWMHDDKVVRHLKKDFKGMTLEDCEVFIAQNAVKDTLEDIFGQDNICKRQRNDLHLAIVDDEDKYMGTVSLKAIDSENSCAEFAIVVCREGMGKGYGQFAMGEMLKVGFEKLGLHKIYWCVSKENGRAQGFYQKNGYGRTVDFEEVRKSRGGTAGETMFYLWYIAERE